MKNINKLFIGLLISFSFIRCDNDGIDAITKVDPGPDAGAPEVTILSPAEGTTIQVLELITSVDIEIEVEDDIEVQSVTVTMDGAQIAAFNEFMDYRIVKKELSYDNVTDGDHTLTVTATDLAGNTTTSSTNFSKLPAYTPLFAGEILYMPFDGTYMDLVSITNATKVGTPGFAGSGFVGSSAYLGATDSYITYPVEGKFGSEFSAAFWYKVSGSPDRAGILVVGANADDRLQGFRLFREGSATEQRIKLNVGTGDGESWNDGGVIDVNAGEWVHVAFTISETETVIYFNGNPVNTATMSSPIDWTNSNLMTIGAGGTTFSYWNHLSDNSPMDELRLFDKALSQGEIQDMINVTNPYESIYDGETFYMPFNGSNTEYLSNQEASATGSPGFAGESIEGSDSFAGAADAYLTFPTEGLFGEDQFSTTFWYKVNSDPDRAGILVVGDDIAENRTTGFRIFREGSATEQRIKLNVGTGDGESWNDGGVIDATVGEWVHIAVTVSPTESKIYFNGVEMLSSTMSSSIDWTGTDMLTIGSGGETFSYWGHASDTSFIDELRFYNKALTSEEIQEML